MIRIKSGQKMPQRIILPTPSFGLNYVLNGGFLSGTINSVWGPASCGKTSMLLHMAGYAQELGYEIFLIDAERSYSDEWALNCGLNLDKREVFQSNIAEEILKEVVPFFKSTKSIVIVDSINTMESEKFFEKDEGSHQIGRGAVIRRLFLTRLSEHLDTVNNAIWVVYQQSVNIGAHGSPMVAKMGEAERHWNMNIIHLYSSHAKENVERDIYGTVLNKKVAWAIDKSKQAPVEGTKGHYWLTPATASINRKKEIIDLAIRNNIIAQAGPWFRFNEFKVQGLGNLLAKLQDSDIEIIEKELIRKDNLQIDESLEEEL
jgi:recombination protein RecA